MESFINYIYNKTIISKHLFIVPYYLIIFLVVRLKYTEVLLGLVFIYRTVQFFLLNCMFSHNHCWNLEPFQLIHLNVLFLFLIQGKMCSKKAWRLRNMKNVISLGKKYEIFLTLVWKERDKREPMSFNFVLWPAILFF